VLIAVIAGVGCAKRATAYRFRAPLIDGVAAPEVPPPSVLASMASSTRARVEPFRAPETPKATPMAATLYGLVGERDDKATSLELALRAIAGLDLELAADVRGVPDGAALVEAARARNALASGKPLLGDLVVFDGLQGTGAASLVGVVVSSRGDGTVEFVYLGLGVVRRGYLNTRRPRTQRDRAGRVFNTWLRVKRGHYRRGLAGEFFSTYIRVEKLAI
jgi:hypothetical protein